MATTKIRRQNVEKKSIALSKKNLEWVHEEAERLGISVSEVVRRALDAAKERQSREQKS